MNFIKYLSLVVILLTSAISNAQQGLEIGGIVGLSSYYGDLNPLFSFKRLGPTVGGTVRKNFDGRVCLRFSATYANIGASDSKSSGAFEKARNLSFSSNIIEGSAMVEFNFQNFHGGTREDKPFSPYLLAGVGFMRFNPQARYEGKLYNLQELGTEGQGPDEHYSLVAASALLGGGIKLDISRSWSINVELVGRATSTDYLDDVSKTYADHRTVAGYYGEVAGILSDRSVELGERIGEVGRQRGDSKNRDSFLLLNFGLIYKFTTLTCPAYGGIR